MKRTKRTGLEAHVNRAFPGMRDSRDTLHELDARLDVGRPDDLTVGQRVARDAVAKADRLERKARTESDPAVQDELREDAAYQRARARRFLERGSRSKG